MPGTTHSNSILQNLTPDDHSLWKATKRFKRLTMAIPPLRKPDSSWARSNVEKSNQFAQHLAMVFTPHPRNTNDDEIEACLDAPCQMSPPLKAFSPTKVRHVINRLNPHKAPGYDLIDGTVLKNLPRKAVVLLTSIFNSMLRLCYFPVQWKYAQLIMMAKPGKPPTEASSYRPTSFLPIMSKVFERLLLHRLDETIHIGGLLPIHQFGFRNNHSIIQQCHRVVNKIKESFEGKKMCTSVFLDIQQAFDKVRLRGLLYKLKLHLPDHLYLLLKSYLSER